MKQVLDACVQIFADPEAAAEKVIAKARAEKAAAALRRKEAEAAGLRADEAQKRLDIVRRSEIERRKKEDAQRAERIAEEDRQREEKAAELTSREEAVTGREEEISRKAKLLGRAVDNVLDQSELDAVMRIKDQVGELGGVQRQRGK